MDDLARRLREAADRGKPDGVMVLATSELRTAADRLERGGWIETAQHLPHVGVRVLVWADGHLPQFAYRAIDGQWVSPSGYLHPTHWAKVLPPQ